MTSSVNRNAKSTYLIQLLRVTFIDTCPALRTVLGNIPQILILSHVSYIKPLPTANDDISFLQTGKTVSNYVLHLAFQLKAQRP